MTTRPDLQVDTDIANAEAVMMSLMHGKLDHIGKIHSNKSPDVVLRLLKGCRFCVVGPTPYNEYGVIVWTGNTLFYVDVDNSVMVEFRVYDSECPRNIRNTARYNYAVEMMDAMNYGEVDQYHFLSCNYNTNDQKSVRKMKTILKNHYAKLLVPAHDEAEDEGYMVLTMTDTNCFIGTPHTSTLHEVQIIKPSADYIPV